MTALHQYDRLEAVANVRHGLDAGWDEVILQLGSSTLILMDTQGRPLSHWSLATMRGAGTQDGHTIYDLTPDGHDQLSIDDPDMIAALSKIENAVIKRQAKPKRRLRHVVSVLALCGVGLAGYLCTKKLPDFAYDTVTDAQVADIGTQMVARADAIAGPFCEGPEGMAALRTLENDLASLGKLSLHVVPMDQDFIVDLPGDVFIIPVTILENAQSSDAVAGHIVMGKAATIKNPTFQQVLSDFRIIDVLNVLIGNDVSDTSIHRATQSALSHPMTVPSIDTTIQAFDVAGISSAPYAKTAAAGLQEMAAHLIEKDPYTEGSLSAVLPDGAFLGLQAICE